MKKALTVIGMLAISASAFGFVGLLNLTDFEIQENERSIGPALSSEQTSSSPWESYNQWQCFSLSQIDFECAVYDERTLVPSLRVENESDIFAFDLHVEDGAECEKTLIVWRSLAGEGAEICIFAAHLPGTDLGLDPVSGKPISLWYIDKLTGDAGYWTLRTLSDQTTAPN